MNEIKFLDDVYTNCEELEEHYLLIKKRLYEKIDKLKENEWGFCKGEDFITPTTLERQLAIDRINEDLDILEVEFNDLMEELNGSRERV